MVITMVTKSALRTIPAAKFKAKCLELMDQVARTGEHIVITKRGVPVAQLAPVVEKPKTMRGFMAEDIEIMGDIVASLDLAWDAERR